MWTNRLTDADADADDGDRRQEQALQEAFRRADNSSEGKLTVDDYLKV